MIAVDTSVVVAMLAPWHEGHRDALRVLAEEPRLPAHAAIESYSVLTRLPYPYRVPASIAADFLGRVFPEEARLLPALTTARRLPRVAEAAGVSGGAIYDALIAVTARDAGAKLVTRDRRALPTYQRMGAEAELRL